MPPPKKDNDLLSFKNPIVSPLGVHSHREKNRTFGLRSPVCCIKLGQMLMHPILLTLFLSVLAQGFALASIDSEFEKIAMSLRERAIRVIEPPAVSTQAPSSLGLSRYPWKRNIVTTVFWVGERPTRNNPVPNCKSSWDPEWHKNFGGYDNPDPKARRGFLPLFIPRQNPFYVALPYNDVTRGLRSPSPAESFRGSGKRSRKSGSRYARGGGWPSAAGIALPMPSGKIVAPFGRITGNMFLETNAPAPI